MQEIKIVTKAGAKAIPELRNRREIYYMSFPGLEATGAVKHLFSTRLGGVSRNEFASMNLSFTRGDDEEAVRENYRRIAKLLDCRPDDMVATYQTHTKNLRVVTAADKGNGVTREKDFFDIDGLLTNEPGVVLLAYFADCVPLYFVNPVKKVIALGHSGWRGTCLGIGEEIVRKMQEEFGCRPSDIHAAIGPSICQDCYEVSRDLVDEFSGRFWPRYGNGTAEFLVPMGECLDSGEMQGDSRDGDIGPENRKTGKAFSSSRALFLEKENGKYQLDLWLANELVLLKAGILPEHLETTNVCTCCNPELLFSHRASKGKRGNLCAFLALKNISCF